MKQSLAQQLLNEILSSRSSYPFPTEYRQDGESSLHFWDSTFEYEGSEYTLSAMLNRGIGELSVAFTKDGSFGRHSPSNREDTAHLFHILSYLVTFISKILATKYRKDIRVIAFTSEIYDTSRQKLYAHLGKRFAAKLGGKLDVSHSINSVHYDILLPTHEVFNYTPASSFDDPYKDNQQTKSRVWEWEFDTHGHVYLLRFFLTHDGTLSLEFQRDFSLAQPYEQRTPQEKQDDTKELFVVMQIVIQHLISFLHHYQSDVKVIKFHASRREPSRVKLYDRFARYLAGMVKGQVIIPSRPDSTYKEYLILTT